tara:strand:- start:235 stop:924 length:690 start_codon:yes stop_codon:yes gene_type:complete
MATALKILIIEDDKELNQQIAEILSSDGYQIVQSYDGEDGLIRASSEPFDLILLDVMLPLRDGFSVLKILRKNSQTPVIMVTAKGAEEEKVLGFSRGADDYVAKPFSPIELKYRIEAILRRSLAHQLPTNQNEITIDNLTVEYGTQLVTVSQQTLDFTPIQFKLLWELILHKGETLTKAYLYQRVLNRSISAYDRSLDMHLSRVRRKLNNASGPGDRLQTSHGKGYCFK